MSTITDIDPYYIKSLTALHSRDHLTTAKPSLQVLLEDAIKVKTGFEKNLTPFIQNLLKSAAIEEFNTISIEDTKTNSSSDNELELDLDMLKEDLMCVVCRGIEVGARNQLLECTDCHSLYHQECHRPVVTQRDVVEWVCAKCKECKRARKSPAVEKSSKSGSRHGSGFRGKSSDKSRSKSGGSSRVPNVRIMSADKRIQIMKKKAAKLHEKKKLPR